MKMSALKTISFLLGICMLVFCFQNCSQNQFASNGQSDFSSLGKSDVSLEDQNSPVAEYEAPRIVLSDSYNGPSKEFLSPQNLVYGTVYGLGHKNVYVCMGNSGFCELGAPGYNQYSMRSTFANGGRPVESLHNWAYNQADGTWRFTLDYRSAGDLVDKIVVHQMNLDEETGSNTTTGLGKILRLERLIKVRSISPGVFFAKPRDPDYFEDVSSKNGGFGVENGNYAEYGGAVKVTGLGDNPNLQVCIEKMDSGRCTQGKNYIAAGVVTHANHYYNQVRKVWYLAQVHISGLKLEDLGAVEGSYTFYAKNPDTQQIVTRKFEPVLRNAPPVTCRMQSTDFVVGPCSDPEANNSCSQSNVGQTAKGTGSCKATYRCECQ